MRRSTRIAVLAVLLVTLTSCSAGGRGKSVWVMSLRPHQCADLEPGPVAPQLTQVHLEPCDQPHFMETYARVQYVSQPGQTTAAANAVNLPYPGDDVLKSFAREACADTFRTYLGAHPRLPAYVLTYLYPSVRAWTATGARRVNLGLLKHVIGQAPAADRSVVCLVRTKGWAFRGSVFGGST